MGAAIGAVLALVALVGVAALATNGVPGALMQLQPAREALMQYQPASDWDGAYAVRYIPLSHDQQGQQHQQSLVNAGGAWKLVNKCSLFGCHTVRVAGQGRKLEAEHEARLRAMKSRQDAKLMSQRRAMEMELHELHERRAVIPSESYMLGLTSARYGAGTKAKQQPQLVSEPKNTVVSASAGAVPHAAAAAAASLSAPVADAPLAHALAAPVVLAPVAPAPVAAAPAAQTAESAIMDAFAQVDSENPLQAKALAAALEKAAKEAKAAAAAKAAEEAKKAQKPADSLRAEAKKALADSASVQKTVQQEISMIQAQAGLAEKKIQEEEKAEVKAIRDTAVPTANKPKKAALLHQQAPQAATPAAPAPAHASLPLQAGPRAAHFASSPEAPNAANLLEEPVEVAKKAHTATLAKKAETKPAAVQHEAAVTGGKLGKAGVATRQAQPELSHDHAARPPKAMSMGGDQKPRGARISDVAGGYWQASVPSARSTAGPQKV
jgi:hypothetical protein